MSGSRKMDVEEDYEQPQPLQAVHVFSSSAEGELEQQEAGFNFTFRRKSRRKTITLNDVPRPTLRNQSLSESAFGSQSPSPLIPPLPPAGPSKLSTSFKPEDYATKPPTAKSNSSPPRRTSARTTAASSPTKRTAGTLFGSQDAKAGDDILDLASETTARGRGVPRTLTLPAHLTESLMKMKLSRDREGSFTDHMAISHETEVGEDKDGMEIDGGGGGGSGRPSLQVAVALPTMQSQEIRQESTPSPRRKRRRARSLPPRARPTGERADEDEENDADDEDGGKDADDETVGILSPIASKKRGRREVGSILGGTSLGSSDMAGLLAGSASMDSNMPLGNPGALRRSARRSKPEIGSAMQLLLDGSGNGDGMEGLHSSGPPRKRARTREGADGERGKSRDVEERVVKKTRKR